MPEPKKIKEAPLPVKFNVSTHIIGHGEKAKFIFHPVGADGVGIALPKGTDKLAFEASDPAALHLQPDTTDIGGLTVIGKPVAPGLELDGLTVHGQVVLPGADAPIEGTSEPINCVYGPIGAHGHKLELPETDEQKAAKAKAKSDAKERSEKARAERKKAAEPTPVHAKPAQPGKAVARLHEE
jgi:hypothetical protein